MSLHMQDELVIQASPALKDSKASLAHKVPLVRMALLVLQVRMVPLEHLDHRDLKAIRVLLAKSVNQEPSAELVILASRASLVSIAKC